MISSHTFTGLLKKVVIVIQDLSFFTTCKYRFVLRAMSDKDMQVSPSCSSFEVLDPHDPVISRLATQLFRGTNDYLQGEMSAGQEHYQLLEEVNRVACSKFGDLRSAITNLHSSFKSYHDGYIAQIKPLLDKIDALDEQINAFEANAYRLDAYTRELRNLYKELEERS